MQARQVSPKLEQEKTVYNFFRLVEEIMPKINWDNKFTKLYENIVDSSLSKDKTEKKS
ncbi:MAG: hypothetical protein HRK26_04505 [Rickettsiaceae bacterium H1]|nr:hypothetical protein [Rickettsiaceae bacterium H1]